MTSQTPSTQKPDNFHQFHLRRDRPDSPGVDALLARHIDLMRASSPAESCHVMTGEQLVASGAILFSLHDGSTVVGVGALKALTPEHGEIKSMHTAAELRGRGIARTLLTSILAEAEGLGMSRVSLETGVQQIFMPARALYMSFGFEECGPFGDYALDPNSVFMTKQL